MRFKLLLLLPVLTLAAPPSSPFCPPRPATPEKQKEIFKAFATEFYLTKKAESAYTKHIAEDYIEHNPMGGGGRKAAIDFLTPLVASSNVTIARTGFSNSAGWVFFKEDEPSGGDYHVMVDIYRMDGTCIVEHWDIMQARNKNATNPLQMFDGQTLSNRID
jgi:predicted SnoaL-like aldol condensation-catalyzing enzyme